MNLQKKYKSFDLSNRGNFLKSIDLDGALGVEIGVGEGNYSYRILTTTNVKKLFSIDMWEPNPYNPDPSASYQRVLSRFKPFIDEGRSEIIKSKSTNALSRFEDESLDFIYIDGDHSYEGVMWDLQYFSKLKYGGIICGHDYSDTWPETVKAVNEFFKKRLIYTIGVGGGDDDGQPSWAVIKGSL